MSAPVRISPAVLRTAGPAAAVPLPVPADPATRMQLALRRLDSTRGALRMALILPPDPPAAPGAASGLANPLRRLWRRLRRAARRTPVGMLVIDAAQGWWRHHPWQPTGTLLYRQARPALRRHPLVAVLVAALAGAALVVLRPWRWQAVHSRMHPLPGRVLHWLLVQVRSAPVQAALASLALMALRRTAAPAPGPTPGTTPGPGTNPAATEAPPLHPWP